MTEYECVYVYSTRRDGNPRKDDASDIVIILLKYFIKGNNIRDDKRRGGRVYINKLYILCIILY